MRVAVQLDYLVAAQLIAACEARAELLRAHIENGVTDPVVELALVETIAGELAIRSAFRLDRPSEAVLDALHDATHRELDELAEAEDIPLADPDAVMLAYQRGELH